MFATLQSRLYGLLRWSESYTKLDMVYLASGSFWIMLGQIVSNVLSLAVLVAFANLLAPETYGLYRYLLSLAGLLGIFSLTGMNNAVARAVAVGEEGALRASVRYQLKWNLFMLSGFLALSGYYFLRGDELFALSFLILGIFVPTTLAFNTYGSYLEGKKAFRLASIATILSTVVYTGGMLTALFLGAEIIWLIAVYAGSTFFTTAFFYFYTLRSFSPPKEEGALSDALKYGRHLSLIGLIGPVVAQVDKIILVQFWGTAQLAAYALAMAVPDKATALLKNWVGIGSPKFAQKTAEELNSVFYTRIFQGMGIGFLCFVGYVVLSPLLFTYLLPRYLDALMYSQIAALAFIFAIPNRFVSLLLVSQKLSKAMLFNSLAQSGTRIALYILLGIWGGIMGLVIAAITMSFLGMLINIVMWRHASRASV